MDELTEKFAVLRKQHANDTNQNQATVRQISTESREQPQQVKLSDKLHKESTGRKCGACGEDIMKMVIPQLSLEYPLPCKCQREKMAKEKAEKDAAHHRLMVHILTDHAQIPIDAQKWTLENFTARTGAEKAFDIAKQYAERFSKAKQKGAGLVIYGCTGCGKSHLAAAIANAVIRQEYAVRWWTVPELYAEIRATYSGNGSEGDILHECKNVSLLILDDLGAEKPSDTTRQTINMILNSRISNRRPTVITTNLDSKMLLEQKIIDERTLSRLSDKERFTWVQNYATDYRRKRHG